jgi:hypothetical protein
MANPNINSSTIPVYAGSEGYAVTTSMTAFVSNSSNSNTVVHITNLMVANVDGVNAADITVELFNGTTGYSYCKTLTVPADATQVMLTRNGEVFLKEGYSLRAQASAAGDLEITWTEKRMG